MKRVFLLLLAAMFLAAGCAREGEPVRLLYWNIQNGMWDGQNDNYDRFVDFVKAKDPDICVWAEAQSIYYTDTEDYMKPGERYLTDNWEELAARYGHKYVYVGGHRDSYPQAITSRYPIENIDRIIGNEADTLVLHGCGWAKIKIAGKDVNIVTLHLAPHQWAPGLGTDAEKQVSARLNEGDKFRRKEIQYICEHTIGTRPEAKDEFWVMTGDFNSRSRADNAFYGYPEDDTKFYVHDYIASRTPYIDALSAKHPGVMHVTMHYPARLDYVYLTRPLLDRTADINVCRDFYTEPVRDPLQLSNFWRPSDHRPIIADFKL